MTRNSENTLLALLTGVTIGAGIGILYAPDKGAKTRKKIKQKAENLEHDIAERVSHAKEELAKTVNHKKEEFDQKLDDAISDMSGKADDIIKALESKLEELKRKNAHLQKN